jgi:MFS family permease
VVAAATKTVWVLIDLGSVAAVSAAALIWWERRCVNPVLPPDMFTLRSLQPLFALSLIMGFCMFAVMDYAPLMFQGGFGLSPNQAGLLITPMAVFITVGSIANGRIVTRLSPPNVILYIGLGLFWLAALALTQTTIATPHALIAVTMMLVGLGLGLLLPNLTLFAQASAPRVQLGVATAMLQSMRMIGGMLGMALAGTLVSHRYAHGVNDMLQADNGIQWARWLDDPQILVNHTLAAKFGAEALQAGHDAALLLTGARTGLVNAIHSSQWLVVAVMALALWALRRVPAISLHRPILNPETTRE